MWNRRRRYNVPRGSKRACYCKDSNTYSRKCCEGDLWNQGIGRITASEFQLMQEDGSSFILQENGHKINI